MIAASEGLSQKHILQNWSFAANDDSNDQNFVENTGESTVERAI
jgi:hypothetical protein